MKIKNQRGFTLVEGLVVLVVLVVLGGAGYYVWHRDKSGQSKVTMPVNAKSQNTTKPVSAPISKPTKTYPLAKAGQICSYYTGKNLCVAPNHQTYQLAKVATTAKYVAWSNVPSDLQAAINDSWHQTCTGSTPGPSPAQQNETAQPGGILLNNNDEFADVSIGYSGGGAHYLYVESAGKWKNVGVTQLGGWACGTVEKYNIPVSFLASPDGYEPGCWPAGDLQGEQLL